MKDLYAEAIDSGFISHRFGEGLLQCPEQVTGTVSTPVSLAPPSPSLQDPRKTHFPSSVEEWKVCPVPEATPPTPVLLGGDTALLFKYTVSRYINILQQVLFLGNFPQSSLLTLTPHPVCSVPPHLRF